MNNDEYKIILKNIISKLVGKLQNVRVFKDIGFANFSVNNLIINIDVRSRSNYECRICDVNIMHIYNVFCKTQKELIENINQLINESEVKKCNMYVGRIDGKVVDTARSHELLKQLADKIETNTKGE